MCVIVIVWKMIEYQYFSGIFFAEQEPHDIVFHRAFFFELGSFNLQYSQELDLHVICYAFTYLTL